MYINFCVIREIKKYFTMLSASFLKMLLEYFVIISNIFSTLGQLLPLQLSGAVDERFSPPEP